jgi:predicted metal-dependent HD superfamily phosphohydrolase
MFAALDVLVGGVPPAVACAVWWHDAVYDPPASDNEERSADLARWQLTELGARSDLVEETVRLVGLTAGHDPAEEDAAGTLLSDADLAILAAGPERYRRYVVGVREEYGHVDDEAWRSGRASVLRGLLSGGIYRSPTARTWEPRARDNVLAELATLETRTG